MLSRCQRRPHDNTKRTEKEMETRPTRTSHVVLALTIIFIVGSLLQSISQQSAANKVRHDAPAPIPATAEIKSAGHPDRIYQDAGKPFESVLYYFKAIDQIGVEPPTLAIGFFAAPKDEPPPFLDLFLCPVQKEDPILDILSKWPMSKWPINTRTFPVKVSGFIAFVDPGMPPPKGIAVGTPKRTWLSDCTFQALKDNKTIRPTLKFNFPDDPARGKL